MTVKELIEELLKLPPDMDVLVGTEWFDAATAPIVKIFWLGGGEDSKECVLIPSAWEKEKR